MRKADENFIYMSVGGFFAVVMLSVIVPWFFGGESDAYIGENLADNGPVSANPGAGCAIPEIPDDARIHFVATIKGYQNPPLLVASKSAYPTSLINLTVTDNEKPVFLVLSAYDPVLWNIQAADDVEIAGIMTTGHHGHILANVPDGIEPSFFHYDDPNRVKEDCLRFKRATREGDSFDDFKDQFEEEFGRKPDTYTFKKRKRDIKVGPDRGFAVPYKPVNGAEVFSVTPIVDARYGIRDAQIAKLIAKGALMRLPREKLVELKEIISDKTPHYKVGKNFRKLAKGPDILVVVEEDTVLPAGMISKQSATIIVPDDVKRPTAPVNSNITIDIPLELNDIVHLM